MASIANRRSLMVLYSDKVSPLGHAVRIVLAEKDVNVEINLQDFQKISLHQKSLMNLIHIIQT